MTRIFLFLFSLVLLTCCQTGKPERNNRTKNEKSDLMIVFGSCNNQRIQSSMWAAITALEPDYFIWAGDIVYADTEDMSLMREAYQSVQNDSGYVALKNRVKITGTWDDHDYGLNDGGEEWLYKDSVQQILLDFLGVDDDDARRRQEGVYHSKTLNVKGKNIKIIVLDTRYFRSALTKDPTGQKRYVANPYGTGTMLGDIQWKWLEKELSDGEIDFNLIVSSIQFLSGEHGFESWSNMPHEVDRMIKLIETKKPNGVIFLSGDRHIAEISRKNLSALDYPLLDFTASGMTHSYSSFSGEPNRYRVSDVVSDKNYGLLKFDLEKNSVELEIRSEDNEVLQSYRQSY